MRPPTPESRGPAEADHLVADAPALPWREADRLAALAGYDILDTGIEQEFDDIARLAADICEAPIAVVNLVAENRQWFKAEIGLGVRETALDVSLCAHAILQRGLFVVPDTTNDPRFACNPLVTGAPGLRFYAGALLETADGLPLGTLCVLDTKPRDVTERQAQALTALARQVMTQLELRRALATHARSERRLAEAEERYRLAARATNDAIWDWDFASDHVLWNAAIATLFGYGPGEVGPGGAWWVECIHPEDRERVQEGIHAAIDGEDETWSDEYRFRRADGSYAFVLDRGYISRDATGRAVRMIGAMLDISERRRSEEHQAMLAGELQHRIKNTLAMVQSIANQTMRNAGSLEEARDAFSARLLALSHAHDVLTQSSWAAAPIATIVEGALAPHQPPGADRIRTGGPVIQLEAKPALALALALHELATNAAKYGALSNETGHVELRWRCEPDPDCHSFHLSWTEHGGPPVVAPPKKGFGTRLIERGLAGEFGGTVTLDFAPDGFICTIEAPLPGSGGARSS